MNKYNHTNVVFFAVSVVLMQIQAGVALRVEEKIDENIFRVKNYFVTQISSKFVNLKCFLSHNFDFFQVKLTAPHPRGKPVQSRSYTPPESDWDECASVASLLKTNQKNQSRKHFSALEIKIWT